MLRSYSPPEWVLEIIKDPDYKPPYTGLVFDNGKLIKK